MRAPYGIILWFKLIVIAMTAGIEQQRHQAATDHKREYDAEYHRGVAGAGIGGPLISVHARDANHPAATRIANSIKSITTTPSVLHLMCGFAMA